MLGLKFVSMYQTQISINSVISSWTLSWRGEVAGILFIIIAFSFNYKLLKQASFQQKFQSKGPVGVREKLLCDKLWSSPNTKNI